MMPYQSLQEASAALGRDLTLAENLWFNYSAAKSDFILHGHNILFMFFFYSLLPLPFLLMELSRQMDDHKIQPKVKRSWLSMVKCYKDVMLSFAFVAAPLQAISYPTGKWIGIRTDLSVPAGWEIFWQVLVYFLVEDYGHYWMHRLLHSRWGYRNIHHKHHEYTATVALAAPYAHWAEIFILGLPSFLGPAIVPCHILTYWLWFVLRQLEAIDTHCGYEFPWSPTRLIPFYGGAEYHDYHHRVGGHTKSNFASVFTYCDYIYGTDKTIDFLAKEAYWQYGQYLLVLASFLQYGMVLYYSLEEARRTPLKEDEA